VEEGAKVVLAARNGDALRQLANEINASGGQAASVAADVGREEDVKRIADTAMNRFGGFDTWVNDAGASIYGRIEEVSNEDNRRLFDTNFWGVVYGSQAALEHLKHRGGAIINVGSTVSTRSIPLQGMYSASKFAVRSFTDALRMEVEEAGYPVAVTLIKPAGINTPYPEHAKSYLPPGQEPTRPPPVYAPEAVARAILHAARHGERDLFVGAGGKAFEVMEKYAPRLTDKYMEHTMFGQQQRPASGHRGPDGLHTHGRGLMEDGDYQGHVMKSSLYTQATMHPWLTGLILGATGALVAAALSPSVRDEVRERVGWS
jgi:short-subunit dehydrogenase